MAATSARRRPAKTEYAAHYETYVGEVPEGDIVAVLRDQLESTLAQLRAVPPEKIGCRYAPDKWTLQEVVEHVVDTEWVFTYRALSFARADTPPLPSVDPDQFMAGVRNSSRRWPALLEEFRHLRSASTLLFESLGDAALVRIGTASGNPVSVRALLYIIAGHERHHMNVLRERYLG